MHPIRFLLILPGLAALVAAATAQSTPSDGTFAPDQLDQLVAPVALYPDDLLSQVLMAATYPLEIVQAQRWKDQNASLRGAALDEAMGGQPWDPSVKSLVAFPEALELLNGNLDWTQDLGNAVLSQQGDVMDAVQRMRARALAAGNLASTPEQKVVVEKEIIVLQPATPERVYVPVYSPVVVYGPAWVPPHWYYPWHAYPRTYWYWGRPVANAVSFTAGFVAGALLFGGCDWHGHGFYWHSSHFRHPWYRNHVDIDVNVNRRVSWNHNPSHRHGVRYTNTTVNNRYGKFNNVNANLRPGWERPDGRPALDRPGERPTTLPARRPGITRPEGKPDLNRPTTLPAQRPGLTRPEGKPDLNRPSTLPAQRPDIQRPTPLPAQRPNVQRPETRPGGGAFSGAGSAAQDRAASLRGSKSTGNRPAVSKPSSPSRPSVSRPSPASRPSVSKPSRPSGSRGGRR